MARTREAAPWSELATLEGGLEQGLARGYALRGEERYFRERALASLRRRAEELGHELCFHEASKDSADFRLARLVDDLSGGGLFSARRLVVVRNPGELLKKSGGEDSALTRAALAFLASPDDPGTLVVSDSGLRADHALVKAILARGGLAPAFRRLWDSPPAWNPQPLQAELVQWCLRRAQELGLRLSGEQALYVCAATGNDLAGLDDQLQTLKAGGGRELRSIITWTAGGSPWSVGDHLLAGDLPRALMGLEQLFAGGFQEKSGKRLLDPAGLSALLVNQLQRGARAALELSRPGAKGPAGSPQQRAEATARAKKRGAEAWRALLEEVADLERALKSGAGLGIDEFARFALRWSLSGPPRARAATPAGPRDGARR
jgi:DNA polymerase III delta subunit